MLIVTIDGLMVDRTFSKGVTCKACRELQGGSFLEFSAVLGYLFEAAFELTMFCK